MAQDQLKTILSYVKDVLGVESFAPVTAGVFPPQAPTVQTVTKPYLFIGSYSGNAGAITEMQTRMVAALKLSVADFEFINVEQTNVQPEVLASATVVVVFGDETRKSLKFDDLKLGEATTTASQRIIFTHSLAELATSAPLKKQTWTHLQSVF